MRRYYIISLFLLTSCVLMQKVSKKHNTMRIETFTKSEQLPELIEGSALHSALTFRSYENTKASKPYMFVAYDDKDNEIGHILVVRRRRFCLFPPILSYWYNINGEGVYRKDSTNNEEIFTIFLEKVFDIFDFRHTFIKVHNIEDPRFAYDILRKHDFVPTRDRRMYISLHSKAPQERLTRAYRAHIRKALNSGVAYRQATTQNDIDDGIQLLRNYYISKRRRLPSKETLNMMLHNSDGSLSRQAKMFVVTYKGKAIGSSFCIYDKERAYLAYYCGLRKSHPMQYPGIMAIWAALTDAHKQGYAHFEFLEVRARTRINPKFINSLLNYGGKQKGTLRWFHFKCRLLNKILRAIYV